MEYRQEYSHNDQSYDPNLTSGNLHLVSGDMLGQDVHYGGGHIQQGHMIQHGSGLEQFQGQIMHPSQHYGNVHIAQGQNMMQPGGSFVLGHGHWHGGPQFHHQGIIQEQPQFIQQGQFEQQGAQPIGYIVGEPIIQNGYGNQSFIPQQQMNFGEASFGSQMIYPGQQERFVTIPPSGSISNFQLMGQQQPLIYGGEGMQFQSMQPQFNQSMSIGQPLPGQSFLGGYQNGGVQMIQGGQFESPYQLQGMPIRNSFSNFQLGNQQGPMMGGMIGGPMRSSFANHSIQPPMGAFPPIGLNQIQNPPSPYMPSTQLGYGQFDAQPQLRASLGGGFPGGIQMGGGFQPTLPTLGGMPSSFGAAHHSLGGIQQMGGVQPSFGGVQPMQLPTTQFNASNSHFTGLQKPQAQQFPSQFGNAVPQQNFQNPTFQSQTQNKPVLGGGNVESISLNKNREYDSLSKKR